jgi:hypothetical protein
MTNPIIRTRVVVRSGLVHEIGQALSQRAMVGTSGATSDHGVADVPSISALVSRIRHLFEGQHGSAMQ